MDIQMQCKIDLQALIARWNIYLKYGSCNLSNLMPVLNSVPFFQYECCLRFDIRKDRTIHIFTHYIKKDMTELRAAFKSFAHRNIDWIDSVGVDVLARLNMTALDFVNGIVNGLIEFNELAMLVLCRALNIHCVVLLRESFFSTQCLQKIDKCLMRLAYTGDSIFKEITTSAVAESKDTPSDESLETDNEDLQGTGILDEEDADQDSDVENEQDSGDVENEQDSGDVENEQDSGVENEQDGQVDVKPLIRHPITFKSSESIVIDDSVEEGTPTSNTDRVPRARKYTCHLCLETFEMQKSFVMHFAEKHPNDKFQCEFCHSEFTSANGLFKHERSHVYMKYVCPFCAKKFQFPYQLLAHKRQHTGIGRIGCSKCSRTFGSKCSKDFHEKTHGTSIVCQLCPMTSTKTFNSQIALNLHVRGMHGPGWTAPCGKHYKWKSSYSSHMQECKKCTKIRADRRIKRFSFFK